MHTILINIVPGTGHSFLSSLIIHSLIQDPLPIKFPELGHAHDYAHQHIFCTVLEKNSNTKLYTFEIQPDCNAYQKKYVDFDHLKSTYDNFKYVIITPNYTDENQLLEIEIKHFYKFMRNWNHNNNNPYWVFYKQLEKDFLEKSKNPITIRFGLSRLTELTPEEVRDLLYLYCTIHRLTHNDYILWSEMSKANDYSDNIVELKYSDLMGSMDITLNLVEKLTGNKRTTALENSYINYVERQRQFVEKYMPWLPK